MLIGYSVHFVVVDIVFFFKQKTAYEMRISDWSSDVCSSDLGAVPADPAFARLGLIVADQRDHPPGNVVIGEFDRRAEPDAALVGLPGGIDDARRLHAPGEKAQAPVDFAQPLAAVYIIAILAAVAVACRPADHLDQLRPLVAEQRVIFGAQRGIARRAAAVSIVPRPAAL